jgi:predicted MFS family arabinose efflux permease
VADDTNYKDTDTNPYLALSALVVGVMGIIAAQILIPLMLPVIINSFEITSTQAGAALSVMWACAAVIMYPGGHWSDHLSRRLVLVGAVSIAMLSLLLLSAASGYLVFVTSLAILGIGIGLYEPSSMASVSDHFKTNRGRAYGIISASYNLGSIVAVGIASGILLIGPWQLAFLPVILILLLALGLLHYYLPGGYHFSYVSLHPRRTINRIVTRSKIRIVLLIFCLHLFIQQGAISFYPTLLQVEFGYTSSVSNLAFASIYLIGLLFSPLFGYLGDRFGNYRMGLIGSVQGALGIGLLVSVPTTVGIATGTITFAFGMLIFWPVMTAELINELSAETAGGDYGALRSIFFGVGSLGPLWIGTIAAQASYAQAYLTLAGGFLLTGLLFSYIIIVLQLP